MPNAGVSVQTFNHNEKVLSVVLTSPGVLITWRSEWIVSVLVAVKIRLGRPSLSLFINSKKIFVFDLLLSNYQ